jgi:hypothetical protein
LRAQLGEANASEGQSSVQPAARGAGTVDPDSEFTLTIDDALERYDRAGLPRTARSVPRYCAKGHLDCRRIETPFGEKYLISPASVSRHIGYIAETESARTSRDLSRRVDAGEDFETRDDVLRQSATTSPDVSRRDATGTANENVPSAHSTSEDTSRQVAAPPDLTERYIGRLEGEVAFLREELTTKNAQIKELTERSRETNVPIGGLQRLLAPMLGSPDPHRPTTEEAPRADYGQGSVSTGGRRRLDQGDSLRRLRSA